MVQKRWSLAQGLAPWSPPESVKEHMDSSQKVMAIPKFAHKYYDWHHANLMPQLEWVTSKVTMADLINLLSAVLGSPSQSWNLSWKRGATDADLLQQIAFERNMTVASFGRDILRAGFEHTLLLCIAGPAPPQPHNLERCSWTRRDKLGCTLTHQWPPQRKIKAGKKAPRAAHQGLMGKRIQSQLIRLTVDSINWFSHWHGLPTAELQ